VTQGGLAFVGLILYSTHVRTGSKRIPATGSAPAEKVPAG